MPLLVVVLLTPLSENLGVPRYILALAIFASVTAVCASPTAPIAEIPATRTSSSRLLAALVQHWLVLASVWGDPTKSLSKACEAIRGFVGRVAAGLDRVTELARSLKVTRGRKLRIDGTVVATAIHYPTDSTLLADGVRVLTRTIQRAKPILLDVGTRARTLFRNRTRSVRRVTKQLIDAARRRGLELRIAD